MAVKVAIAMNASAVTLNFVGLNAPMSRATVGWLAHSAIPGGS